MNTRSIVTAALLLAAASLPMRALGQGASEFDDWLAGPQRQLLTSQEWRLISTLRGPAYVLDADAVDAADYSGRR